MKKLKLLVYVPLPYFPNSPQVTPSLSKVSISKNLFEAFCVFLNQPVTAAGKVKLLQFSNQVCNKANLHMAPIKTHAVSVKHMCLQTDAYGTSNCPSNTAKLAARSMSKDRQWWATHHPDESWCTAQHMFVTSPITWLDFHSQMGCTSSFSNSHLLAIAVRGSTSRQHQMPGSPYDRCSVPVCSVSPPV